MSYYTKATSEMQAIYDGLKAAIKEHQVFTNPIEVEIGDDPSRPENGFWVDIEGGGADGVLVTGVTIDGEDWQIDEGYIFGEIVLSDRIRLLAHVLDLINLPT